MHYNNWYLIRLFRKNKLIFIGVLIFIAFQIYFNNKRVHSFPFFVWDMYSRPQTLPSELTQTEVFIDGKRFDITKLSIWEELTVLNTSKYYSSLRANNYHDFKDEVVKKRTHFLPNNVYSFVAYKIENGKTATEAYPAWLHQYLEKITHSKIKSVELKTVQYHYLHGKFQPTDSNNLILKTEH